VEIRRIDTDCGSTESQPNELSDSIPLGQWLGSEFDPGPGHGRITWATGGEVVEDPKEERHIGATAHTNNTGELSAMHYALKRALRARPGTEHTTIWSDSLYAINMTDGTWLPRNKRNRDLVARLRGQWKQIQRRRPGEVRMRHVRSHIRVPGNEIADWIAGTRTEVGRQGAASWASGWIRAVRTHQHPDAGWRNGGQPRAETETPAEAEIALSHLGRGGPGGERGHGPNILGDPTGVG